MTAIAKGTIEPFLSRLFNIPQLSSSMETTISRVRVDTTCASFKNKTHPTFAQPVEIASFSLNSGGDRLPPILRKFIPPPIPTDLNEGYETYKTENPSDTSDLKPVLDILAEKNIDPTGSIVTYRNNLNKILSTPFDVKTWEVDVKRENGVIYLGIKHLDSEPANELHRRTMYWGRRFEEVCTEGDKGVQYCSVVKTKLNTHRIILGAEIDCYSEVNNTQHSSKSDPTPASTSSSHKRKHDELEEAGQIQTSIVYTELKTHKEITNGRINNSFRRWKLLHFWLQSFLAGVPYVLCGFRDDNGIIVKTQRYNTLEIPRMAEGKWDPWVCLNFADVIFTLLWAQAKEGKNYVLKFSPPYENVDLVEIKK